MYLYESEAYGETIFYNCHFQNFELLKYHSALKRLVIVCLENNLKFHSLELITVSWY